MEIKPCRDEKGRYKTKHGMYGTRLYHIWEGFNGRCLNPNNKDFPDYGGRGISVCDEWRISKNFFDWAVESGYSDRLTLDRIDYDKGYSPENCRWITSVEQQRNKRNNKIINYNGESHCLAEWGEILGIDPRTINSRLRLGWSLDRAFTQPVQKEHRQNGRVK